MRLEFLGTGTSYGVPQIGCPCIVCSSSNPRDKRTRCSIWVQHENIDLVVDTGPDFRFQCLRCRIPKLDAVLFTHFHADHVFGVDDIRQFNTLHNEEVAAYVPDFMKDQFLTCFGYTVSPVVTGLNRPRLSIRSVTNATIPFGSMVIEPVTVFHGEEKIKGYIFKAESMKIVYLTDCKTLPEETVRKVSNADILILSALWKNKNSHPAHLNLDEALELSQGLMGKTTFLTHLTHKIGEHRETSLLLPENVKLAYDGLVLP